MYPNPQAALPLPPQPTVDAFEQAAADLVAACQSDDRSAIGAWAERYSGALSARVREAGTFGRGFDPARLAREVEPFARATMSGGQPGCARADAQLMIGRIHGFPSWSSLAAHVGGLGHAD